MLPHTTYPRSARLGGCLRIAERIGSGKSRINNQNRKTDNIMSNDIQQIDSASKSRYTSIKGSDLATQKKIFAAITNAQSLADHLNKTINLKHVIIQPVTTENEKGEIENFLRTVLIADDGV